MKYGTSGFAAATVVVSALLLAGCAATVPQSEFDALQNNFNLISAEKTDATQKLNDLQVTHSQVIAERDNLETERDTISAEYDAFREKMSVYADLSEQEAQNQLEEAQRQTTLHGLDEQITAKQTELDRLTSLVVKTGEEPIRLPAGEWNVGSDIPAGRYLISHGSSNFFARRNGRSFVNIILGGGSIGIDDYTVTFYDGDEIETRAPATLTPVQEN